MQRTVTIAVVQYHIKKNKHNRTNVVLNSNKLLIDSVFFLVFSC